ncbi:MAG: hypothetical protein ACFB0B_00785 [Thermonemataceae bacterium]
METFLLIVVCSVAVFAIAYFVRFAKQNHIARRAWVFGICALVLIPFGLAWAVTSFAEGEPFAGYMGVAIFSGAGLIFTLLAYNRIVEKTTPVDTSSGNIGLQVLVGLLVVLGALLLPVSLTSTRIASLIGNQENAIALVNQQILSDEALPVFFKETLAYETLYGAYPKTLEERLMQSMISGVSNEQIIVLLDKTLPEKERLVLLEDGATAVSKWFNNDQPYPEWSLEVSPLLTRMNRQAVFLMGWMYQNFELMPMPDTTIAKFNKCEFSDNLKEYLGTPPDSLKQQAIIHGARALQKQIAAAKAPDKIALADQLKEKTPPAAMKAQKSTLATVLVLLKMSWLFPLLLFVVAFGLANWKLPQRLKTNGWLLLTMGAVGLIVTWGTIGDVAGTVYNFVEGLAGEMPSFVLAFLNQFLPAFLQSLKTFLIPFNISLLSLGLLLIAFAYQDVIRSFFNSLKTPLSHGWYRKKDSTQEA